MKWRYLIYTDPDMCLTSQTSLLTDAQSGGFSGTNSRALAEKLAAVNCHSVVDVAQGVELGAAADGTDCAIEEARML